MVEIINKPKHGAARQAELYGIDYLSKIGKLGGRPSYEDTLTKRPQKSKPEIHIEEEKLSKASLATLKALWKQKQGAAQRFGNVPLPERG